jgi:hypothetical protein
VNIVKRVEVLEARPLVRVVQPEPVPLDCPADVLALLAEQVNAVRSDVYAEPTERARTLGFLASLSLRAMESRDLTARLEAVERVLKLREKAVTPNGKKKVW